LDTVIHVTSHNPKAVTSNNGHPLSSVVKIRQPKFKMQIV